MRARLLVPLLALIVGLGAAKTARASVNLGLGADWFKGGGSDFNLTLGADTFIVHSLSLGGRAGVAFFDDGDHLAIPMDLRLKLHVEHVYFEGLVGPWWLIDAGDRLRFHGAFGFGVEAGRIAAGLEVGKLSETTMLGLRIAFRL